MPKAANPLLQLGLTGINLVQGSDGKESVCNAGNLGSIPGLGRSPWKRAWKPTLVFLPGESHEQRSLAGYSPWGLKGSDPTERLRTT